MMDERDIMTDGDVAALLGISKDCLQKRIKRGFRRGEIDLMAAEPVVIGGMRRWLRADVERVLREKAVAE